MANLYGVNATNAYLDVPSEKVAVGEYAGRMRVAYDQYTLTAAFTTSDVLFLQKIPKGARVYNVVISTPDMGNSSTWNVGWGASVDGVESAVSNGFYATLAVGAGAATISSIEEVASAAGLMKQFASEVQLQIVPAVSGTATSGTIQVAVFYVLD